MPKPVRFILALLLQIGSCSSHCPWPGLEAFEQRSVPMTIAGIRDAIASADDEYVVVSETAGPDERKLSLIRVRNGVEEPLAVISDLYPIGGDDLIRIAPARWWYSRAYKSSRSAKSRVFFVSDAGSGVTRSAIDITRTRPILWLPLRGRSPAGVLLSIPDETSIVADEVSGSGVKQIGSFPTIFPGSGLLPAFATAERLPDGRIALFSLEEQTGYAPRFRLRAFQDGGQVIEKDLPCAERIDHSLSTAVGAHRKVAVVAVSAAGEVVAMLVDPDQAERSPCRIISPPGEIAANAYRGSPTVVAADGEFFVGWIRNDGRLRLGQLSNLDVAPLMIDAGEGAATKSASGSHVDVNDDETLTLTWKTDRGIATRRIPQAAGGFALLSELDQLRCGWVKRLLQ